MHSSCLILSVWTLANPAILWGAAACAGPILIHFMMRTRARRQRFPAMQFLMASKKASIRRHRLRHLLLLALRMLVILLLVAALARPVSRGSWMTAGKRGPTAAALVIDDSASMGYRFGGRTRLEKAAEWTRQLIANGHRFPAGSQFMVTACGIPLRDMRWIDRPEEATAILSGLRPGRHDRPLGSRIAAVLERLDAAEQPSKELYVLTDMSPRAWSDAKPDQWKDRARAAVYVLDAGDEEDASAAIGPLRDFRPTLPARTPYRINPVVRNGRQRLETEVEALLDGQVVARSRALSLAPQTSSGTTLILPATAPGPHGGEVRLTRLDALDADDSFFFAVDVATPARVVVLAEDESDVEARRLAALISPPSLAEDRRPFDVAIMRPMEWLRQSRKEDSIERPLRAVVLIDSDPLADESVEQLREFVDRGGTLLVAPGLLARTAGAEGERLFAARMENVAAPAEPTRIDVPVAAGRPANSQPSATALGSVELMRARGAVVSAVSSLSGDSISTRRIYRYRRSRASPGGEALMRFATGDAAVWGRAIGAGLVVQWTFRLDSEWSDLGARAGPMLVLIHSLLSAETRGPSRAVNLSCGEQRSMVLGSAAAADVLSVRRFQGRSGETELFHQRCDPGGLLRLLTEFAGLYEVRDSKQEVLAYYAVNLNPEETDGSRLSREGVQAFFAPGSSVAMRGPESLYEQVLAVAGDREMDGYALVILLAMLVAETWVANRFYRN